MTTVNELQQKVNEAGMGHVKVINKDHIEALIDGEPMIFERNDQYGGHPLSGIASYGMAMGDHRMISVIAEDMESVFEILNS